MKKVLWIIMFLSMVGLVSALNCSMYSDTYSPFEKLDYICDGVVSDSCYTMIYYENPVGGLINARPYVEFGGSDLPVVSSFVSESWVSGFTTIDNVSIVQFSTKGLRPDYLYNFEVRCGNDVYAFNSTLLWKEPTSGVRGLLYIKDNTFLLIVGILLVSVLVVFVLWFYDKVRYRR